MKKYTFLFNLINNNTRKIDFDDWSNQDSVLINGITGLADHVVLHGLFKYKTIGFPDTVVVGILFCGDGEIGLIDYN